MQKLCAAALIFTCVSHTGIADSALLPGRTDYNFSPEIKALDMPYQGEPFAFVLRAGKERRDGSSKENALGGLALWIPPTDYQSATRLEMGLRENSRWNAVSSSHGIGSSHGLGSSHALGLTAGYGYSFTPHLLTSARVWWGREFGFDRGFDYGAEGSITFENGPFLVGASGSIPLYFRGSEFSWKGLGEGLEQKGFRFGIEIGFRLLPRPVMLH